MKIFWLDDGLHLSPENQPERDALTLLFSQATKSRLSDMFPSSGIGSSGLPEPLASTFVADK